MADGQQSSIFGSGLDSNVADYSGGGADAASAGGVVDNGTDALPPNAAPTQGQGLFGSGVSTFGLPKYTSDPQAAPLDAAASLLEQRIQRANAVSSNPVGQLLNPEGVAAARQFVVQGAEQLQKIRQQKATIQAGRQQAETLGLAPGEVPDEADQAARIEAARAKALKGDLNAYKGIQAVDPKTAEVIAPQVQEVVSGHLANAQFAFDKLSNMQSQGEYNAALGELRKTGVLTDLEALGLKVPPTFDAFNAVKAREGQALREAHIGINDLRTKLEERNTYQPMEKKEAETYNGRLTTAYGDQITNGTWSRNASSGTRGLVVNGANDPRDLGKTFSFATPEQRKAITEEMAAAIPKEELSKYRAENRTYDLATRDAKGNKLPDGQINTNPNVQQGIAEGLAAMLRGGNGGANIGLLKIETGKRGFLQGLIDTVNTEKAGVINELKGKDVLPYLSKLTQSQIRDVLDALKQYNDVSIGSRATQIAERAGALGLKPSDLGLGKDEVGGVGEALERGRQAQIERMMPNHQAIGGGDGVFQLGAQRPGAGASALPPGTGPSTQQPGGDRVATPVQQAARPPGSPTPSVGPGGPQVPSPTSPQGGQSAVSPSGGGGGGAQTIAGQSVSVPSIPGVSPTYVANMQRIESGNERDPWKAGAKGSSASGAFQFINGTWKQYKPDGAPDRAGDATPQQQAEAMARFTADNVKALRGAGVPVTDVSVYMAHNVGAGPAATLLKADPGADARSIVGEKAAANNPLFFKGRPTVATVLARYQAEMNGSLDDTGPKPQPGAAAEAPSLMQRVSRMFSQGVAGGDEAKDKAVADVGNAAVENAPAIGSTLGAIGGSAAGPAGTVAGGAAGGGAGQALKDYLQGREQSGTRIAKETALGGVLGVGAGAGRPLLGAAARAVGAGGVEAGASAAEGGDAGDIVEAGGKGVAAAAGGEAFGRALGMVGHKVWNMFAPEAKTAVREAAQKYADAEKALATEAPKLPGVNGAAGVVNPKYEAAERAKAEAEMTLKDAGLKPDEAAYAHKVSSEGVPRQEAEASRPGAIEQKEIGKGYQKLEGEIGDKGVGAVRGTARQRTSLPESERLTTPRPPTSEELATKGRVESVPLSEVRATQSTMQWDRFNKGDHPPPIVKGFEDKPVAVKTENGEYLVFDGHHRTVKAMNAGQQTKDMYVIDAKAYDPANAGRKPKPSPKWSKADDDLLAELGGMPGGSAPQPRNTAAYNPILNDGPMAAVTGKQVAAKHGDLAERVERTIAAPAPNWQAKWIQLKTARSELLQAERDALSSTSPGRSREAADMRKLADTVRVQQEKAAKYVFGEKDGEAFMKRLNVLDTRYRNLMEATNGGDLAKAAAMKGEAGREAQRKFEAFAHDDAQAIAAFRAMRKVADPEKTVPWTVVLEGVPVVKHLKIAVLADMIRKASAERAAGAPAKFSDLISQQLSTANRDTRDLLGTAAQRGATMQ